MFAHEGGVDAEIVAVEDCRQPNTEIVDNASLSNERDVFSRVRQEEEALSRRRWKEVGVGYRLCRSMKGVLLRTGCAPLRPSWAQVVWHED